MLKQFYFMKEGTKRNGFAVMNRNQNFYHSVHYFVTVIDFSANFLLACRQHTHRVVRPRKKSLAHKTHIYQKARVTFRLFKRLL